MLALIVMMTLIIDITLILILILMAMAGADKSAKCVTDGKDLLFVQKLLTLIEKAGIPAPSPIEQVDK